MLVCSQRKFNTPTVPKTYDCELRIQAPARALLLFTFSVLYDAGIIEQSIRIMKLAMHISESLSVACLDEGESKSGKGTSLMCSPSACTAM